MGRRGTILGTVVAALFGHGFPHPADPGNVVLNYQYKGTAERAFAVVNEKTDDVVSTYTKTRDDRTGCANCL